MTQKLNYFTFPIVAALLLLISACASQHSIFNMSLSNSQVAAEKRGLLGRDADKLSSSALKKATTAEYQALENQKSGGQVSWQDSKNIASGTVTAGHPYRVGEQNCRQYSHEWNINGVPNSARGSACRNDDGSWTPLI